MLDQEHPLSRLIEELKKIPSIGGKTAQRIAFYIIGIPQGEADRLADAIKDAKQNIFYCSVCNSLTHVDPCMYCSNPKRDQEVLCVVEEPFNISSIEKTGIFRGVYHVLHGALSPLKGIGPDELKTDKLIERLNKGQFKEIILATNPTAEGEATALYLVRLLKDFPIKKTRLAMGLPVGSDIDFADQVTIKKSLEGRTELTE
ncbi:MAG: recombination protein RecR [Candidatus Aminicenantes bacterium]|nr:MAG: recombination protein RecR [Candidatus Aminicenantes bacterium]